MPTTYTLELHDKGPALWPAHKALAEVLELQRTTPESTWSATYQGSPTPPGGVIFKRDWWNAAARRFDASEPRYHRTANARWLSLDTALKEKQDNDFTAWVIGELWPDYRLAITVAMHERMEFPRLHGHIESLIRYYASDGKLKGVLIEDKGSGTSVLQTLRSASDAWIAPLLLPFMPQGEKAVRWKQSSIWCANGSIVLPFPGPAVPWLLDFEDELFLAPSAPHDDMTDAFGQLIIYLEHVLARGDQARHARTAQSPPLAMLPVSRVEQAMQDDAKKPVGRVQRALGERKGHDA
jgi:predicted phage terminase large subunit-like protein